MQLPRTLTSTPSRILKLLYYILKSGIACVGLGGGATSIRDIVGGPWCPLGTMVVPEPAPTTRPSPRPPMPDAVTDRTYVATGKGLR